MSCVFNVNLYILLLRRVALGIVTVTIRGTGIVFSTSLLQSRIQFFALLGERDRIRLLCPLWYRSGDLPPDASIGLLFPLGLRNAR